MKEIEVKVIEIDNYFDIPLFLEIESPTEEELVEILKMFNFKEENVKTWNDFELLKHYNKKY
jgi:hypothetical protein